MTKEKQTFQNVTITYAIQKAFHSIWSSSVLQERPNWIFFSVVESVKLIYQDF